MPELDSHVRLAAYAHAQHHQAQAEGIQQHLSFGPVRVRLDFYIPSFHMYSSQCTVGGA